MFTTYNNSIWRGRATLVFEVGGGESAPLWCPLIILKIMVGKNQHFILACKVNCAARMSSLRAGEAFFVIFHRFATPPSPAFLASFVPVGRSPQAGESSLATVSSALWRGRMLRNVIGSERSERLCGLRRPLPWWRDERR